MSDLHPHIVNAFPYMDYLTKHDVIECLEYGDGGTAGSMLDQMVVNGSLLEPHPAVHLAVIRLKGGISNISPMAAELFRKYYKKRKKMGDRFPDVEGIAKKPRGTAE